MDRALLRQGMSVASGLSFSSLARFALLWGMHKGLTLAVFFVVLELASMVLDIVGETMGILLAAFLLSVVGATINAYFHFSGSPTTDIAEALAHQQLKWTDILLSVTQLINSSVQVTLKVLGYNKDFKLEFLFPLGFSILSTVFVLKNRRTADSNIAHLIGIWVVPGNRVNGSGVESTQGLLEQNFASNTPEGDLSIVDSQLVEASTPTETLLDHVKMVDDLGMRYKGVSSNCTEWDLSIVDSQLVEACTPNETFLDHVKMVDDLGMRYRGVSSNCTEGDLSTVDSQLVEASTPTETLLDHVKMMDDLGMRYKGVSSHCTEGDLSIVDSQLVEASTPNETFLDPVKMVDDLGMRYRGVSSDSIEQVTELFTVDTDAYDQSNESGIFYWIRRFNSVYDRISREASARSKRICREAGTPQTLLDLERRYLRLRLILREVSAEWNRISREAGAGCKRISREASAGSKRISREASAGSKKFIRKDPYNKNVLKTKNLRLKMCPK